MTDTAPDVNGLINLLNALAIDFECDDNIYAKETCDKAAAALEALSAENERLRKALDCHLAKTKQDVAIKKKIAATRQRHLGIEKDGPKIKSAGFPKREKPKRFDVFAKWK